MTQALLGAVVGEACFGQKLGPQAALWGAVGGLVPDVDIVLAALDPMAEFLYHRGPTHAFWFGPSVGALLGHALWWTRGGRAPGMLLPWIGLMVAALLTHPLLDVFTTYGTQLLTPFSRWRFSLDAVPIVDPTYTLLLLLAVVVGWRVGYATRAATLAAWVALGLSTAYLFYGVYLNHLAVRRARAALAVEGVATADVRSYPTMFQLYLRRVVVHDGDEVRVGWLSLWNGRAIVWERFRQDRGAEVERVRESPEARTFEWFTSNQTAARVLRRADGEAIVEIGDLRFGLPGLAAQPFWGVRARFDRAGHMVGGVERFRTGFARPAGELLRELWRATFD